MKWIITLALMWGFVGAFAQNNLNALIKDEWYEKEGSKGLQVGDRMPDLDLGKILNNYTGKTKLSDFKDKLLILDFWTTYCSNCIAAFPEMEKLQKEFGDKIQIILVNPDETEAYIQERLKQMKGVRLPNLPCVVANRNFLDSKDTHPIKKIFPLKGVPHHVWIDQNGIIRLRGHGTSTYAEKIKDFLADKPIFVTNDANMVPNINYDTKVPLYKMLGNFKKTTGTVASIVTPYTDEIFPSQNELSFTDSVSGTKTRSFINQMLVDLYWEALKAENIQNLSVLKKGFFSLNGPRFDLSVLPKDVDTTKFSEYFDRDKKVAELDYVSHRYCYEQTVSLSTSRQKQRDYMLEDLNRYFEDKLSVRGHLERRKINCYLLKEAPAVYGKSAKDTAGSKRTLSNVLSELGANKPFRRFLLDQKAEGKPYIIFSETNPKISESIKLPVNEIRDIETLRAFLKKLHIEVVEVEREFNFLVFEKTN